MMMLTAAVQAQGLGGLWEIEGTPDGAPEPAFTNLARMDKDGTMVNIDPWFGTGLGQWEKVGAKSYVVGFTHYFLDAEGVGTVEVSSTLNVADDNLSAQGEFLTTISIGGVPLPSIGGTVAATRQ
jgi:hypothetical protein